MALARALVMSPRLLLADEPTGNLDSRNAHMVRDLFLQLSKDRGVTIALVTHDEEIAKNFGRQLVMKDGVIDPTKVVRLALQDAASVAGLLITTEAMVAEKPEKKAAAPMGGHDHGGMGGMDF